GVTHLGLAAPAGIRAGDVATVTVTALDAFNNTVPGYAGTVHFTTSDGGATLPADAPLTRGVGTFAVTFHTAGGQTLTAGDSGGLSAQAAVQVTPAAAASYRVSAPTSAAAGVAFAFTVTALDAFGNVATGYTGAVHFGSTDPTASLPADATLTGGVGNFTATLAQAGNQTLTATDVAGGAVTGGAGVAVSAVGATHFAVSAAATAAAGSTFSLVVTALDPYGNTAIS